MKKTMAQDILDSLHCRVTLGELERDNLVRGEDWDDFKKQLQDGDELWYFRTPEETWTTMFPRCGMEGYAIVRHGSLADAYLTSES